MYTFADLCGPFNFIICGEQLNPFTVNPYPLSGQPSLISGILELWVAISVQNDDLVSKKMSYGRLDGYILLGLWGYPISICFNYSLFG